MNQSLIPKLNKRFIYLCLMAAIIIAVPLILIPMAQANHSKDDVDPHSTPQVWATNADDAFALSGTNHFPKNYGAIKEFEEENINLNAKQDDDPFAKAFAHSGKLENQSKNNQYFMRHQAPENHWQEAREAEQKRRAFEHYEAMRSDILFKSHDYHSNNEPSPHKRTASLMNAMERSLQLAENSFNQGSNNDVFFARNSPLSNNPIGEIKNALPHMISEGTLIPAILLSEINTDLPGPILARISHNIWDSKTGQILLIPQNSQLIGEYSSNVGHGQGRAKILWTRIIFPNQQSVNLGSMVGVDKRGTSGTEGIVDHHYDKVALGLMLTTVLGSSVRMTQGKYDPHTASMGQEFGNALAQETARLGNKVTDKMLSIPPTIKVPMGQRLNVFVEQDLSLQPYQG
jgi:type IV secretory pathway VirB10-like protein